MATSQSQGGNSGQIPDPSLYMGGTTIQDLIGNKIILETISELMDKTANSAKTLSIQYKEMSKDQTEISDLQKDILSVANRLGNVRVGEGRIIELQNKAASKRLEIETRISKMMAQPGTRTKEEIEYINLLNKQKAELDKQSLVLGNIRAKIDDANDASEDYQKKLEKIHDTARRLSRIPLIGKILDEKALSKAFEQGNKQGFIEFSRQLRENRKDLIVAGIQFLAISKTLQFIGFMFRSIKDTIFGLDKTLTSLSNNMGISKEAAESMYDSWKGLSIENTKLTDSINVAFLSMKNMGEAMAQLQESFGTNAMLSDQMLQNQIMLTKQMGLTEEESTGIQRLGVINKTNAEAIVNATLKVNKSAVSYRRVLQEISKINSEIAVAYGLQVESLTKAVVQANKLGMSLEDTLKISNSLLNFESSIEGELKAELLTNKQLNFEKARALALDGKSAEAAAELIAQVGGLNNLMKLNVIQRKAMAESIGLSSEELTKMAQQQELLNQLGAKSEQELRNRYDILVRAGKNQEAQALLEDIRRRQNGELLAQDIAKASLSARFEESMNRVKEVFIRMSGPITSILNFMAKMLEHTQAIKVVAISLVALLTAAAAAMAVLTFGAAPAAAGVGAAIGLIGGAAGAAYVSDSVITPNGNIAISTPRGKIVPDKNDSIITTTDPQGLLSGGGSNAAVVSELKELKDIMRRGGSVYIDSVRSGTAYAMGANFAFA